MILYPTVERVQFAQTLGTPYLCSIRFSTLYKSAPVDYKHITRQDKKLQLMTIDELINKTSEHIGSNPHLSDIFSPINIGTIFSFLYSLIVVPNELYRDDKSDFLNKFEFNINKLSNFAIDFGRYYTENFNK